MIDGTSNTIMFAEALPRFPFANIGALVSDLKSKFPQGVDRVIVRSSNRQEFQVVTSNGIIAILIGLLLPAVQKCREAANSDARLLQGMLKAPGKIEFPN